jgi:hypothetical protein
VNSLTGSKEPSYTRTLSFGGVKLNSFTQAIKTTYELYAERNNSGMLTRI